MFVGSSALGFAPFFFAVVSDDDESRVAISVVDLSFFKVANRRRKFDIDESVPRPAALHLYHSSLADDFKASFAIKPSHTILRPNRLLADGNRDGVAFGAWFRSFVFAQGVDVALGVDFGIGNEMAVLDFFVGESAQGLITEGRVLTPAVNCVLMGIRQVIGFYAVGANKRFFHN